jgi:hypothetical protein
VEVKQHILISSGGHKKNSQGKRPNHSPQNKNLEMNENTAKQNLMGYNESSA